MSRHQSGPSVVVQVVNAVVFAALAVVGFIFRLLVLPFCRWYMSKLREGWHDVGQRRTKSKAVKQFRPSRRQQRRIVQALLIEPDPVTHERALWWCLYVMSREIPATTLASHMSGTQSDFNDAVAYVAAQIYTMPVRFPTQVESMVWATELRTLHGVDHQLPEVGR